jgi:hypothetical protein
LLRLLSFGVSFVSRHILFSSSSSYLWSLGLIFVGCSVSTFRFFLSLSLGWMGVWVTANWLLKHPRELGE